LRNYIIRLTSITYAIRAEKLLAARGIRARIKKLSQSLSVHGCGYGLVITGELYPAVQILTAAGIKIVETGEEEL
jgi:hypothetical protein